MMDMTGKDTLSLAAQLSTCSPNCPRSFCAVCVHKCIQGCHVVLSASVLHLTLQRRSFLLNPGLTNLARQGVQQCLGIPRLHPRVLELWVYPPHPALTCTLEIQIQALLLVQKAPSYNRDCRYEGRRGPCSCHMAGHRSGIQEILRSHPKPCWLIFHVTVILSESKGGLRTQKHSPPLNPSYF